MHVIITHIKMNTAVCRETKQQDMYVGERLLTLRILLFYLARATTRFTNRNHLHGNTVGISLLERGLLPRANTRFSQSKIRGL